MQPELLNWAASKAAGGITEVAVLAPLQRGCIPGERRTYEERAAAAIDNIASRVQQGLPNELNLVPSIHFGRINLIRPEQYLLYSDVPGVDYYQPGDGLPTPSRPVGSPPPTPAEDAKSRLPAPIDEYTELPALLGAAAKAQPDLQLRSFLLTTVEFDGDLRVYFRDIGIELSRRFDTIFENCEDYPGTQDFEAFWLWIRRYQINTSLFYAAYPDLSVTRIKALQAFKRNFDLFVARVYSPAGLRVRSLEDMFDEFLRENQQIASGFPGPGGVFNPPGGNGGAG